MVDLATYKYNYKADYQKLLQLVGGCAPKPLLFHLKSIPYGSKQSPGVSVEVQASAWKSRRQRGSPGISVEVQASAWKSRHQRGSPGVSVEVQASAWKSRRQRGSPGVSVEVQASAWKSRRQRGSPGVSVEVQASAWKSRCQRGSPGISVEVQASVQKPKQEPKHQFGSLSTSQNLRWASSWVSGPRFCNSHQHSIRKNGILKIFKEHRKVTILDIF
ncbi:hypothetical protein H4582DRAFT_2061743 [Lactarius indigo]|nr:hypothetical protein H4582DRAFT_2061743 [Lactarius indigo]